MIHVEDIASKPRPPVADKAIEIDTLLNDDERIQLDFADALAEEACEQFKPDDDMFAVEYDLEQVPFKIIYALKCLWESGGWIVGAFRTSETGMRIIFARPRERMNVRTVQKGLEERGQAAEEWTGGEVTKAESPHARAKAPRMSNLLLVRMPTRGRPHQALEVLGKYRSLAVEHVPIEVVIDEDDATMNNSQVLQQLCDLDCTVTVGRHKNKIDAVNAGRVDDFAVLLLASDDMVPLQRGYDGIIVELMRRYWPLNDGAITLNDGYNVDHRRKDKPVLCTLPIIGRHLLEQFGGKVYHEGYGSLYCDDEYTELLTAMKRLTFVEWPPIIEHKHHAAGKAPVDILYKFNDDKYGKPDAALYERRSRERWSGAQFAFDSPPMVLSILICTIPGREAQLRRLVDHLRWQMQAYPRWAEICVDARADITVGEKRQALLERAVGEYIAFIDDDDWVPHDYVKRIIMSVGDRSVDCLSLVGVYTVNGEQPEIFRHSIQYRGWYTEDGVHYRTPNHLSCVKRELALQVGFVAKNVGEDHDYSDRLRPLLKTEASTGDEPLYFYWNVPAKSVQRSG